jgi:hypothetical protein
MNQSVRRLVFISLLIAMSYALMFALQIPLVPVAPYLKYDPSDVPTLVGSFHLRPRSRCHYSFCQSNAISYEQRATAVPWVRFRTLWRVAPLHWLPDLSIDGSAANGVCWRG